MNLWNRLTNRKTPMRRKLFWYMLALAVIVLAFLACGLFFFGHFATAKEKAVSNLSFQMRTFDRQISKYFEDLTRIGNALSYNVAQKTEDYLAAEGIAFKDLNDNPTHIMALQTALFDKLAVELYKTDCSGAFLLLDATVNTHIDGADKSKTGLYFQRASRDETDETLLLYRGIAEIGRKKGVMPHRQWRLEFFMDDFPDYNRFLTRISAKNFAPFLTSISVLHGTSERIMNFIVPIVGKNNVVYGVCGFEISEIYFKDYFAQSTQLEHLTCLFLPKNGENVLTYNGFSSGVYGGYYLPPQGKLTVNDLGDGLVALQGSSSFVAKMQPFEICGDDYVLIAAYPKEEYDTEIANNVVSVVLLLLLLACTTFTVCALFSRKFLQPLLKGLQQIQNKEHKTSESEFLEIDDLFAFLAEQDRLHDEETTKLRTQCDEQVDVIEQTRADVNRLAYSRKTEVSPDDYEMFKAGLKTLTKTEKHIFGLYLDGKTADEILELCRIQKGTLKYHNHNILSKLGVSSRKQMLRYATLLKQEPPDKP